MVRLRNIHWVAPTTMLVALLSAALLALGHHLFYAHLSGTPTPSGSYVVAGKSVPKQQLNTALGTAFAFLVKASLTLAVSVAYFQTFWRAMKQKKEHPTFDELDCTFSALGNVVSLLNVRKFWRHPLLLLLATITWCIPISSIITPATLFVDNAPRDPAPWAMLPIPQFGFTSLDFVSGMSYFGDATSNTIYQFNGPSHPVQRSAAAVLASGQIASITAPSANASWELAFWGPALRCNDVVGAKQDATWMNIWNSFNDTAENTFPFLAWVPWSEADEPSYTPRDAGNFDPDLPFYHQDGTTILSTSTMGFGNSAALFLAVMPEMLAVSVDSQVEVSTSNGSTVSICDWRKVNNTQELNSTLQSCQGIRWQPSLTFQDATLLRCEMVNTSYSATFKYVNGTQDIQVLSNTTGESPPITPAPYFLGPEIPDDENFYHSGNGTDHRLANCSTLLTDTEAHENIDGDCRFDPAVARQLSYQGILMAFNQLVQGSIAVSFESPFVISTAIMRTFLAQTQELAFLQNGSSMQNGESSWSLQNVVNTVDGWAYPGLANTAPSGSRGSLKSALEGAFQNLTISLLAEPYLQPNYSSPFAPSNLTNVTLESYHNIYVYDSATLWVAYGLAIFFSALAVIVGLVAIALSGASYDNLFSTIVRVARTAEMTVEVEGTEGAGHQPLPKHLAKARMVMSSSTTRSAEVELMDGSATGVEKRAQTAESRSLLTTSEGSGET